jgi:hypothetical protein
MNKIKYLFLFFLFIAYSCKKEMMFDENKAVNNQVKTCINDYISVSIDSTNNYVLSFKKRINVDTLEFLIYAHNSISLFKEDSVFFRAKYLNTFVFSNFRNSSFKDSCGLEEAAQYLDKEEYAYFLKENKVPPPFSLIDNMSMKLIFVNGKLFDKQLFY